MAADRIIGPSSWVGSIGRAKLSIGITIEPNEGNAFVVPVPTVQVSFANYDRRPYNFSSGFNALTVPSNSTVCIIELPENNAQTATLKGVNGDTGIVLNTEGITVVPVGSSAALGVAAGGTITGAIVTFI